MQHASELERRRREGGYALLGVMIGVAIVSVALVQNAMVAGYAVLTTRDAAAQLACRQAALAILNGPTPVVSGGSVAPAAPVDGWHDRVFVDPATGRVEPATDGLASGAVEVERQWRRGHDGAGMAVFEVSASAVGAAMHGLDSAAVVLGRRVR